ncbi:MAG: hypothetical protein RLZZ450_4191 [Pseudomonadota bacterium]|jgi:DNA-binding winged helix-turn-helix (wHTH) protein
MIFLFDDYELDSDCNDLRRNGKPLKAEHVVLRLLSALVEDAGQLVTKAALIERVWDDRAVSENVITVAMVRLRRLLGDDANERKFVVNVHGRGYRFVRPVSKVDRTAAQVPVELMPTRKQTTSFVGREQVMQRLRTSLADARQGQGNVLVLIGEPGIGKTRAAEQLADEAAAAGIPVAWGHCQEAGDTPPLWPWAQLVRELLEKLPLDSAAVAAAATAPELPWLLPRASPSSAERAEERKAAIGKDRVFTAVVQVLQSAASATPCLLILEDLHRADASTVELLHFWVESISRARVLLVGTVRSTERRGGAASAELAAVLGHRNCMRVPLQRLDAPSVTAYVSTILDDPDGRLARAVFAKSEGNPFFMVELARQLSSMTSPEPELLAVTHEALELVRPRLLKLDAAGNGVLSSASVIGRNFDLRLVQAVLDADLTEIMKNLDCAVTSEVLIVAPDSRTVFAFSHDLLRAALYESIPPAELRRLHLRVALALEAQRLSGETVSAALLAFHFRAAIPEGDLRKTVEYSARAAEDASALFAFGDAERHLRHALEALSLIPNASTGLRMKLLLHQTLCARVVGAPEFESLLRELIRLARECRAGSVLARAGLLLDLHPGFPALAASRQTLEEALSMLPDDDEEHRGALLARLAISAPIAYDAEASQAQAELAVTLSRRSGAPLALYGSLFAKLYLEASPTAVLTSTSGQSEPLRELDLLCLHHPRLLSVPPIALDLHRAILCLQTGDLPTMLSALERAEARARRLHCREWTWHAERYRALAQLQLGQVTQGTLKLRALHEQARALNILGSELLCLYDETVVLGDASTMRASPVSLQFDPGDPPSLWSTKVRTLVAADLHDEADAMLKMVASERLAALPRDRDYLGTLGALARSAASLGARDHATVLYDLLAPHHAYLSAHVAFHCEGSVPQLRAELAWTLGRGDEARSLLEAGLKQSADAGLVFVADQARRTLATYRDARSNNESARP